MQSLNQFLASQLMVGTQKHFSSLHEIWLRQKEKQMKEVNATGDPNAGPMSPNATKTRGENSSATGSATTSGMAVGSQVSVNIPAPQRGVDRTSDAAVPANADGLPKVGTI